ncbi:MAG: hypothetical protein QXP34_01185 [Candidatus Aenigmatarchaeota archaeon]
MEITNSGANSTKKVIEDLFSYDLKKIFAYMTPETIKETRENLEKIRDLINDEEVMKLLIEVLKNYILIEISGSYILRPKVVKAIVELLAYVASETKSKEDIIFLLEIFLKEKIKEVLSLYDQEHAAVFVWDLGKIAYYTKSGDVVELIADILKNYTRSLLDAGKIASDFVKIALWTKSKEAVKSAIEIFRSYYNKTPLVAQTIVGLLGNVAYETQSEELVEYIRKIYSKENVKDLITTSYYSIGKVFAQRIAKNLGKIAYITQNEETVDSAVRIFEIYNKNPEIAKEIQIGLEEIIYWIKSKKTIESTLKILEVYSPNPEIAKEIIKILAHVAYVSRREDRFEFFAEIYLDETMKEAIIKSYSIDPKLANMIAWKVREIAFWTDSKEAVKKFLRYNF